MSQKTATRTKQIYVFITMETEGEDWDLVKLALARQFQGGTFIVVLSNIFLLIIMNGQQ